MADTQQNIDLPEGTNSIIEDGVNLGAITTDSTTDDGDTATLTIDSGAVPATTGTTTGTGSSGAGGLSERLRSGGEKLTEQVGDKTRGLVGQGLERTSEALASVSRMVGDTADGIEERLGADYGDYARRAAGAIENAANSLASKDADELIDDTKSFVRSSPGIALAGAAVVGFVLARLIKTGLPASRSDDSGSNGDSNRNSAA